MQSNFWEDNKIVIVSGGLILVIMSVLLALQPWKTLNSDKVEDKDEQINTDKNTKVDEREKYAKNGVMYLKNGDNANPIVGDQMIVELYVDSAGADIDGFDAIINYDNSQLEIKEIQPNTVLDFKVFPQKVITEDKILISALAPVNKPISGDLKVADIVVIPKKEGVINLNFDFVEGKTTDSNIVEHGTVHDILGTADSFELNVE